jgi:DNA-binding beta-propeller fold protein YncE
VLDAASGRLLRTVAVGRGAHALAVHERTGREPGRACPRHIANSDHGTVSVLEARSGAGVHTVAMGAPPGAVAMDERTHDVLVANAYDHSVTMVDVARGRVAPDLA